MKLKQTLDKPINGYWSGGAKRVFVWSIDGKPQQDRKGKYVRIGSWEANHWFHVALGKTEKQTLGYARRRLNGRMGELGITGSFEYIEEG